MIYVSINLAIYFPFKLYYKLKLKQIQFYFLRILGGSPKLENLSQLTIYFILKNDFYHKILLLNTLILFN